MYLMLFYIFCRSFYSKMLMVASPRNRFSRTRAKLLHRVLRKVRHRATSMERQPERLEGPDLEPEVAMGPERIPRSLISHPTRMTLGLMLDPRMTKKNLRTKKNLQVDEEELSSSNPGSPGHHQVQAGQDPAVADADQGQARYIEGKDSWLSYKELMATTYPAKSRKIYLASYVQFENYLKKKGADPNVEPDELSILNYFHHLRTDKKWASTTLWSHFSRVNAVMKRTWGFSMTKYPRVPDLLKGYEGGHRVKKACVFSPQQAS